MDGERFLEVAVKIPQMVAMKDSHPDTREQLPLCEKYRPEVDAWRAAHKN